MPKSLKQIGQEEFNRNQENFFKRIKQIIKDDESPFDETTNVMVYFNIDKDFNQYFRFEIWTMRSIISTDYYPHNYDFDDKSKNVDEIDSYKTEVEIFKYFGEEIL